MYTKPSRLCFSPKEKHSPFVSRSTILGLAATALLATGSAQASLIAQESFDYAPGTPLAGTTGPLGFSEAYTAANAGLSVSEGGYAYGDLPVSGNKLDFSGTNNNGIFGVLTNSPEAPGTTVYLSYLMKVDPTTGYAGVSFFEGATEVLFTGRRGGAANLFGMEPKVGTSLDSSVSCRRLSLVVCRIDFAANSAMIRMYVNPTTGVEPATADLTVTRTSALTYDRLRVQSNGASGSVDELRLGETYADVAPLTYGSPPQEVVVLGSSVASGTGAALQSDAWAYRMENLLENQAPVVPDSHFIWHVENASIGGNNTTAVRNRFQNDVASARAGADMVIVSLSLANEGLMGSGNPQAVFDSFKNGLTDIVSRCRAGGFYPIVSLCYPQNLYTAAEYAQVRRMNLLLNTWDVPSINFLGAIDDGTGHWNPGQFSDDGHPNSTGHGELFSAIVPSLFDAIASGKTASPQWQGTHGYLRLQQDAVVTAPLKFTPTHPVLSSTLSFRVRGTETGTVAAIGSGADRATLEMRAGAFVYVGPGGTELSVATSVNDGRWHDVALSHRHGTDKTLLFIDGQLKGSADDQYVPDLFVIGGAADASGRALAPLVADYQDVAIYRAAWTEDEALAQSKGALQQASLEICAPLADANPVQGAALANRAQSLSELVLQTGSFSTELAANTPDNLNADSFAATKVNLTWTDHSAGAATFTIERRRSGIAEPWATVGTSPGNAPFYEDSGLIAGISYDYRVSVAEGAQQGDSSNVVSIAPAGQDSNSYDAWIATHYPLQVPEETVYLIDFNTNANPNYGGVKWNTVTSTGITAELPLSDTNNQPSDIKVAVTNGFDQFRSDPVAPLVGYAAAAQNSQFGLRDIPPLVGAITFTGLDPAVSYDFSFFARRGALVAGYDYTGTYTFTGSGPPVIIVMDAKDSTTLTHAPPVTPTAAGVVTLTLTAGPGAGNDFPVINFIRLKRSKPGVFLVDFNTNASPVYGGLKWNTVTSLSNPAPYTLRDSYNNASSYTVAITDSFDQFRSDNITPVAEYPAAAQNSQFALRDDPQLTGAITFEGLDPGKSYDFSFLARRGSLVADFSYTGTYTFTGSGAPVVVVMDAKDSTTMTQVPPVTPSATGVVTLTITPGPGVGQAFPVINLIRFAAIEVSSGYAAMIARAADPDGDGVSNFEEYARGFDPAAADARPFQVERFTRNPSGTSSSVEFSHDLRAGEAGYMIQTTTNLSGWQADTTAVRSVIGRNGFMETLRFESPVIEDEPARFFRLLLEDLTEAP
ncbi:GDSL-type esterase/lipase family protein [Luteolibacter sp. Populi]|uniref:GDSL-type esterase/lipase family protein n=1 Tax=Luteolibacter sp. Populi TaxID=3230487 RepID=UPI00346694D7